MTLAFELKLHRYSSNIMYIKEVLPPSTTLLGTDVTSFQLLERKSLMTFFFTEYFFSPQINVYWGGGKVGFKLFLKSYKIIRTISTKKAYVLRKPRCFDNLIVCF